MTTFTDLKFNDRPDHPMGEQAKLFFPNGYGVSVIRGPNSYGGTSGLYELAVLRGTATASDLDYSTPVTDDVLGHLTPEAVARAVQEVASLPAAPTRPAPAPEAPEEADDDDAGLVLAGTVVGGLVDALSDGLDEPESEPEPDIEGGGGASGDF